MYVVMEQGIVGILASLDAPTGRIIRQANLSTGAPLSAEAPLSTEAPLTDMEKPIRSSAQARKEEKGRQVVYLRLRRHEEANKVVLSFAEKYRHALAMVSPLLEKLSSVPSRGFYEALNYWQNIISRMIESEERDSPPSSDINGYSGENEEKIDGVNSECGIDDETVDVM